MSSTQVTPPDLHNVIPPFDDDYDALGLGAGCGWLDDIFDEGHALQPSYEESLEDLRLVPLGVKSQEVDMELRRAACSRRLRAAGPWSPATHALFPAAARARAVELLLLGHRHSREPRFETGGRGLFDLWGGHLMPHRGRDGR